MKRIIFPAVGAFLALTFSACSTNSSSTRTCDLSVNGCVLDARNDATAQLIHCALLTMPGQETCPGSMPYCCGDTSDLSGQSFVCHAQYSEPLGTLQCREQPTGSTPTFCDPYLSGSANGCPATAAYCCTELLPETTVYRYCTDHAYRGWSPCGH